MRIINRACLIAALFFLWAAPAMAGIVRASWYGPRFERHLMANGERFSSADPTIAAHRTLPFGTYLRVTNLANGRTAMLVVKDRGPFVKGRKLDVSEAAAVLLDFKRQGTALLDIEIVYPSRETPAA